MNIVIQYILSCHSKNTCVFLFSNPCLLRVVYCLFCKKWLYVAALSVKYLAAVVGSLAMAEYLSGAMFLFGSARRAASGFQARADLKLLVYGLGASRRLPADASIVALQALDIESGPMHILPTVPPTSARQFPNLFDQFVL